MYQPPPGYAVLPLNFTTQNSGGRATYAFGNVAIPLFFAEKEGDENCECNFGGG